MSSTNTCGQCAYVADAPIRGRCPYCGSAYYWTTSPPEEWEKDTLDSLGEPAHEATAEHRFGQCDCHKGALDRIDEEMHQTREMFTFEGIKRILGQ